MELKDFTEKEQKEVREGLSTAEISDKEAADKILALVPEEWIKKIPFFVRKHATTKTIERIANQYPDLYAAFEGIDYVADDVALEGEEDLMSLLNADSELNFNSGGDKKVQAIVEHAANKDMSFDDIMNDWNAKWTDAQELNGVKILY